MDTFTNTVVLNTAEEFVTLIKESKENHSQPVMSMSIELLKEIILGNALDEAYGNN